MKHNIITGQQTHLLGGPLFVLYKIMGAIIEAQTSQGTAVYWLETNDADFAEVNHFYYINKNKKLEKAVWQKDTGGLCIGKVAIDDNLINLLQQFLDSVQQTEFTPELKNIILSAYKKGSTLGQASLALARKIFKKFPLQFFDPSRREFLTFIKPILLREAALTPDKTQANFFILDKNIRKAVFKKDGLFFDRKNNPVKPENYLLLPNVKTRSICQDAYFNCGSYIAGPAEQKYLKKLQNKYKQHKIQPATIIPRMSAAVIEKQHLRHFKRLSLKPAQLDRINWEKEKKKILAATGFNEKKVTGKCRKAERKYLDRLQQAGIPLAKLKKETEQNLKHALGFMRRQAREKAAAKLNSWQLLKQHYNPLGNPQERIYNIFYYVNLYGLDNFLDYIYRSYNRNKKILEMYHD